MSETEKNTLPKGLIVVNWIVQGIAYCVAKLVFTLLVNVKVQGLENVKNVNYGPVIYASNHHNDLDSVFIRTALPLFNKTTTLFAVCRKKSDYDWKGWKKYIYTDWFFRAMGAYPAHKGLRDYRKSLKTILKICNSGQTVLIFIGGRQKSPEEPIKNRGGASYLSWASGLPVVPVAVNGTSELTMKKIFFARPTVEIHFGVPISKNDLIAKKEPECTDFSEASKIIIQEIDKMRKGNT